LERCYTDGENSDSFNSVPSTIVLPTITGPTDAEYSAYFWVGIDGRGNLNNLFQAGIDIQAIQSMTAPTILGSVDTLGVIFQRHSVLDPPSLPVLALCIKNKSPHPSLL
jgi:hypothetical protein